ncbi:hypothetical protein [Nostoc sp.]|uniref:hypothetical protein n=1 Tax=Nostoc sp. TaxID=1180 RepID=UPI002FFA06EC
MSDLLIQNCQVLYIAADSSEVKIFPNQDILVRGNKIEAIQATGIANASHFHRHLIANGMLAMPGLINRPLAKVS